MLAVTASLPALNIKSAKEMRQYTQHDRSMMWRMLGIIIPLVAGCIYIWWVYIENHTLGVLIPFNIAGVAITASIVCFRHADRLEAISADRLLEKDIRPPILYLRPFALEEDIQPLASILLRKVPRKNTDEYLLDILKEVGPFIAIGKPGEPLPELGAARMYLKDINWHSQVSNLLFNAKYVIVYAAAVREVLKEHYDKVKSLAMPMIESQSINPQKLSNAIEKLYKLQENPKDISSGLLWEVTEAVMQNFPEKLILAVPVDSESYEGFIKATARLFPQPLPDPSSIRCQTSKFIEERNIRGFVYFDSEWTPSFVSLKTPEFFKSITNPDEEKVALKNALGKVFRDSDEKN